jgi:hypothetical protein
MFLGLTQELDKKQMHENKKNTTANPLSLFFMVHHLLFPLLKQTVFNIFCLSTASQGFQNRLPAS